MTKDRSIKMVNTVSRVGRARQHSAVPHLPRRFIPSMRPVITNIRNESCCLSSLKGWRAGWSAVMPQLHRSAEDRVMCDCVDQNGDVCTIEQTLIPGARDTSVCEHEIHLTHRLEFPPGDASRNTMRGGSHLSLLTGGFMV